MKNLLVMLSVFILVAACSKKEGAEVFSAAESSVVDLESEVLGGVPGELAEQAAVTELMQTEAQTEMVSQHETQNATAMEHKSESTGKPLMEQAQVETVTVPQRVEVQSEAVTDKSNTEQKPESAVSFLQLISPTDVLVKQTVVAFDAENNIVTLTAKNAKEVKLPLGAHDFSKPIKVGDELVTTFKRTAVLYLTGVNHQVADAVVKGDVINDVKQTQRLKVELSSMDTQTGLLTLISETGSLAYTAKSVAQLEALQIGASYYLELTEDLLVSIKHHVE